MVVTDPIFHHWLLVNAVTFDHNSQWQPEEEWAKTAHARLAARQREFLLVSFMTGVE